MTLIVPLSLKYAPRVINIVPVNNLFKEKKIKAS